MDLEPACTAVSLVAAWDLTYKWFLSSMCEFMGLQVTLGDKLLFAFATFKWPLSCMRTHVRLEVSSLCKLLQTFLEWTQ